MAARRAKDSRRRAARGTSNVFAMFDQKQIAEFKEAFNMIDQNRDGFIDKQDLKEILSDLNSNASDEYIEEMLSEASGNINFTLFLTLMGERMSGTDTEQEILQAFECFDENNSGFIEAAKFRELMTTMGNRFTNEQVDIMFKGAPPKDGLFDYRKFVRMLKHGEQDEQQQEAA